MRRYINRIISRILIVTMVCLFAMPPQAALADIVGEPVIRGGGF